MIKQTCKLKQGIKLAKQLTNSMGVVIVKLENNKDGIIQSLRNEVSSLQNLKSSKAQ